MASLIRKETDPGGRVCASCGKLAAALFAAASFPRHGENVGNLLFGFLHFHGAGSFHRAWAPRSRVLLFLASSSDSSLGTRRHKEIFGHQWGGPILKVETPALTERRAYAFDRDSARSFPDWHFPWSNGTVRFCRDRLARGRIIVSSLAAHCHTPL